MTPTIKLGTATVPLLDYAIGGAAILGIRDSGKTVTGKGIAEQLLENKIPLIIFDAVGKWRFLKVPSDQRNGKGFQIVVAGGRSPDLPLTPQTAPEIVRSAVKQRIPLIIDLYDKNLSKSDWRRIVQSAIRIIHYENEDGPLHVFLEEAAEYVPQKVQDGETYAEVEKFVRMGGNASVGITLINQRSQEVNKAVLDLCTTLVLGCQVGSKAIEAVEKWVDRLDPKTASAVTESLPRLQSGEAWVWTRQNPDQPTREKIPMCRSFHPDRRTPEVVANSAPNVDTAAFVQKMAATIPKVIEAAKATDPTELRAEVGRLKRKIVELEQNTAKLKPERVEVQVPVIDQTAVETIRTWHGQFAQFSAFLQRIQTDIAKAIGVPKHLASRLSQSSAPARPIPPAHRHTTVATPRPSTPPASNGAPAGGLRRMMIALAQCPDGLSAKQVALRAGLSAKSGSFRTYLSTLRRNGWIASEGTNISITGDGIQNLGHWTDLPTGADLVAYWVNELSGGPGRMLQTLAEAFPKTMSADELGESVGMSAGSGSFRTYLSKLKTLNLITKTADGLRLNPELSE